MNTLDRTTAPAVHDIGRMTMRQPTVTTLSNGIKLLTLSGGDDDVCRLTVLIDGGIADLTPRPAATLIARLLTEGAADLSSSQIADILDYNGAWYKGSAHNHHVCPTLFTLSRRLDQVLPVFIKMVTAPTFPAHETAIATEMMARQLELEREKVKYLADKEATRLIKGAGHPLAHDPTPEEIRAITPDTLREVYSGMLSAGNITVAMAGRLTPEMVDAVTQAFGSLNLPGAGVTPEVVPNAPAAPCRIEVKRDGATQSAVVAVMPAIPRSHPDYIPLRIGVMALGGYFGSRLMTSVREDKGYTYGISASLVGEKEGAHIKIETQCDPRYVEPMMQEIKAEMAAMATRPPSPLELERVKRHYMTTLTSRLESPMTMIEEHISTLTVGTPPDYFDRQQEVLAGLTPELITDVAARYLDPTRLSWVTAGQ